MSGFDDRLQKIRDIWHEYKWLYGLVGFMMGILVTPLINNLSGNSENFLLNLLPEASGIFVSVFVIDRLYRYFQKRRLLSNVQRELRYNLAKLFSKSKDGKLYTNTFYAQPLRKSYGRSGNSGNILVKGDQLIWLKLYLISTSSANNFETHSIDNALASDLIFSNNPRIDSDCILLDEALLELKRQMYRRTILSESLTKTLARLLELGKISREKEYSFTNDDLLISMACVDCEENIVELISAINKAIEYDYKQIPKLKLNPTSPIEEEAEIIEEEFVTSADVSRWLAQKDDLPSKATNC